MTIEFNYKVTQEMETSFRSEQMPIEMAIPVAQEIFKTKYMKDLWFTDDHDRRWSLKDLKKYREGIQDEPHHLQVYFDAGFDQATKQAGLGCVIYYEQNNKKYRLRTNAFVENMRTNNEAEYAALHLTVKELARLGVQHMAVTFTGDSMVVINQLKGEWACYEESLTIWADRIEHELDRLGITPKYKLIPRKQNQEADRLATQALKEISIVSTKEID
ncbi:MAG TPA: reverse transcriptase-like protein [Virgibacillus sp.]|nr:reverse transcriptase-like protein [Virgibacillus sp.]